MLEFIEINMKIGARGKVNFPIRVETVPRAVKFFEKNGFQKVGKIRDCGEFTNNKEGYMRDNYFKKLQFMEKI